jgi:flagellar protein FliT
MLSMPAQIAIYEEMRELSARMVEAARANDWSRLAALETSVASLRDTLRREGEDNAGMTTGEAERKASLIRSILDDDAEIRLHTEPWMEQVREFLGRTAKKRQVDRAYGAF